MGSKFSLQCEHISVTALYNKYLVWYYGNLHNGLVLKTLNVRIFGSSGLINFPFTGGMYHIIRYLYIEYFRNLNFS